MKILFLVQYPEQAPSPRYRVYQMLPWLREQGVTCDVHSLVSSTQYVRLRQSGRLIQKAALMTGSWLGRLRRVLSAGRYDAVYLLKNSFPFGYPVFESLLARSKTPVILDYDDAIYLDQDSQQNPLLDRFRPTRFFNHVLSRVDAVFVPNQFLADHSRRFNDAVHVVPEAEDTVRLSPRPSHRHGSTTTIGWVGSPSTSRYLDLIEQPIREICHRKPDVRLAVVGGQWVRDGIPTEHIPWSLEREAENFHRLDIGLMPLEDNDWCRAKSGCKLRQYMSTGVPSVASAVGYNTELVEHGVTGFLVDARPAAWVRDIERLIDDVALRNQIASAARKSVERRFAIDRVGTVLLQSLETVVRHAG